MMLAVYNGAVSGSGRRQLLCSTGLKAAEVQPTAYSPQPSGLSKYI